MLRRRGLLLLLRLALHWVVGLLAWRWLRLSWSIHFHGSLVRVTCVIVPFLFLCVLPAVDIALENLVLSLPRHAHVLGWTTRLVRRADFAPPCAVRPPFREVCAH